MNEKNYEEMLLDLDNIELKKEYECVTGNKYDSKMNDSAGEYMISELLVIKHDEIIDIKMQEGFNDEIMFGQK